MSVGVYMIVQVFLVMVSFSATTAILCWWAYRDDKYPPIVGIMILSTLSTLIYMAPGWLMHIFPGLVKSHFETAANALQAVLTLGLFMAVCSGFLKFDNTDQKPTRVPYRP